MQGAPGGLGPPGVDLGPPWSLSPLVPTPRKRLGTVITTQHSQVRG